MGIGGGGNMSKTIYVITDGEYSDYHICAIFSEKEAAEEYQRDIGADQTEEWELDEIDVKELRGKKVMFGRIRKDGYVHDLDTTNSMGHSKGRTSFGFDCNGDMYLSATVKDEETFIKILNDTRSRKIAEGTWGKDE
jgi:hypothetical protein